MARSTPDQILETAELLFAEKGFSAVGVRELTRRAGVNVAAVHYHFGSKEDLYLEMVRRHTDPLNDERLRRLDAVLAGSPQPDVREIFAALIDPVHAFLCDAEGMPNLARLRLASRVFVDISTSVHGFQERLFQTVKERFLQALQSSVPNVPEESARVGFYLAVSSLMGTVVLLAEAVAHADPPMGAPHFRCAFDQLIDYVSTGYGAVRGGNFEGSL